MFLFLRFQRDRHRLSCVCFGAERVFGLGKGKAAGGGGRGLASCACSMLPFSIAARPRGACRGVWGPMTIGNVRVCVPVTTDISDALSSLFFRLLRFVLSRRRFSLVCFFLIFFSIGVAKDAVLPKSVLFPPFFYRVVRLVSCLWGLLCVVRRLPAISVRLCTSRMTMIGDGVMLLEWGPSKKKKRKER